ncbi:MAG: hypothetical protein BHW06_11050 [Clostridium sp. 44_14]|nr:MAG: hypothetical protein BHW06_11050 [Clostridium sp. 44_14]
MQKEEVSLHTIKKRIIMTFLMAAMLVGGLTGLDGTYYESRSGQQEGQGVQKAAAAGKSTMKVHYIDVGQGSAVLVQSGVHFMLIDGGDSDASSKVVSYLKRQKVKKLDYVVVSHYDSDHLNGVVGALNVFKVKRVIAPAYTADSRVYESYCNIIAQKKIATTRPKVGKKYNENNYSIALKLVNGKNRFVITGDAETESEYEMVENGQNLSCDVYMAGHHGSANSSSEKLLQAMKPKYTVISCGADNNYGHPAQSAMSRLKAIGTKIFRTDAQGTIVATSNGSRIKWNKSPSKLWSYREYGSSTLIGADGSESQISGDDTSGSDNTASSVPALANGQKYIGNVNSKKFHLPSCNGLPYEKNRVYFDSIDAAHQAGYSPCGLCRPED